MARELGVRFLETSAKANINVEQAFTDLARCAIGILSPCFYVLNVVLVNRDIKIRLIDTATTPTSATSTGSGSGSVDVNSGNKSSSGCC